MSLQGLSDSELLRHEWVQVTRRGKTQYRDGKPLPTPGRDFKIKGSVQPLSGRELLIMPEGDRFKEQYNIYTFDDIQVKDIVEKSVPPDDAQGDAPPSFLREGVKYQVQNVEPWESHRKARITRLDVGPEAKNP